MALVVAHPDDETLALGGSLHLFRRLLLVHVTDGAPRRLGDAAREGYATSADYAAARAAELDAAVALSGAAPERVSLGLADQEAADSVDLIAGMLRDLRVGTVLTHPFEGGHPDHDAVALAASRSGAEVFEFAGYHADAEGNLTTQRFLGEAEIEVALSAADLARKRAMITCFHTQREILSRFDPAVERFRPAPVYDFSRPPAPRLLYEAWGWLGFAEWRARCGV